MADDQYNEEIIERYTKKFDENQDEFDKIMGLLMKERNAENTSICCVLFVIQLFFLGCLSFSGYRAFELRKDEIKLPFTLMGSQFVCSLLFHIINNQKQRQSYEKFRYMQKNSSRLRCILYPFLITWMQFVIDISSQIICMFLISLQSEAL